MIVATTAEELISEIRARGGRVYRYLDSRIVVLTDDRELVADILEIGGKYGLALSTGYQAAPGGKTEWDLELQGAEQRETPILDEDEDVVGMTPAVFPGLWEAAYDRERSAFVGSTFDPERS